MFKQAKVCFIITGLTSGGAESMLLKLLERIDRAKFSPDVISLTDIGVIGPRMAALGVPVGVIGMNPGVPDPRGVFRLMSRLREIRPDIVHTWMYHADLLGGLAARLSAVPAIAWNIRNSDLSPGKTKWGTRVVVRACASLSTVIPDRIICCSMTAQRVHTDLGYDPSLFVVIPNGFDLERFHSDEASRADVRRELAIPEKSPVIGLIARFDPQKNHQGFFEAAGRLHTQRPDVHFLLAGEGVETINPAIAAWMAEAGIGSVTHLLGLREDISRLTAALDIASSSSWGEAFPNVVGEAMACGVPCVVTDVGDSAYIVGDTGRVVPSGDPRALADTCAELLALPESERRALGERARARVKENFELGSVVKRYEAFYDELVELGRKNPRRYCRK